MEYCGNPLSQPHWYYCSHLNHWRCVSEHVISCKDEVSSVVSTSSQTALVSCSALPAHSHNDWSSHQHCCWTCYETHRREWSGKYLQVETLDDEEIRQYFFILLLTHQSVCCGWELLNQSLLFNSRLHHQPGQCFVLQSARQRWWSSQSQGNVSQDLVGHQSENISW